MDNNKIVVLDFDLTISAKHTGGYPERFPASILFDDKQKKLSDALKRLHGLGIKCYINTRARRLSIINKLYEIGIKVGKYEIIDEVYGASSIEEMGDDKNGESIKLYWANKKVLFLNDILSKNPKSSKDNILFFDDTKLNIDKAVENGYKYSFYVTNNITSMLSSFKMITSLVTYPTLIDIIVKNDYKIMLVDRMNVSDGFNPTNTLDPEKHINPNCTKSYLIKTDSCHYWIFTPSEL